MRNHSEPCNGTSTVILQLPLVMAHYGAVLKKEVLAK